MTEPKLQMILEKVHDGDNPSCFQLWACQGQGRGCKRNTFRSTQKHCDDCILARNEETLGDLIKRISRTN